MRSEPDWIYIREERLGMLCEDREPTPYQLALAEKDADDYMRWLNLDTAELDLGLGLKFV